MGSAGFFGIHHHHVLYTQPAIRRDRCVGTDRRYQHPRLTTALANVRTGYHLDRQRFPRDCRRDDYPGRRGELRVSS
jgi:hypothetical protein